MADHQDLTDRLGALGDEPVPADVRAGHLHAMRAAEPAAPERRRFGRLAVAAAALVGFAAGSTGFAMAGALPDPAQGVAHDVLSVVQVDVPDRPDNRGTCISDVARDPSLSQPEKQAAKRVCKATHAPGRSGEAPGRSGEAPGRQGFPAEHPNGDGDPCTGKPPWAGPMDRQAREALKTEHAACRGADDDPAAEAREDQREAEEEAREREAEALEDQQGEPPAQAPPADAPQADVPADPPAEGDPPAEVPPAPAEAPPTSS